jgi:ADP-ribose pyrophosphatase
MPTDDTRESDETERPLETLGAGKFLRLVRDGRWEFVQRTNTTGVVAIVALTDDGAIVLTEQYRAAVQCPVVELPAGLAGDTPGDDGEVLLAAAERELLEETGYQADEWTLLAYGPPSAGMSDECVALFLAEGLTKVSAGGGDDDEQITVHEVPLSEAPQRLQQFEEDGTLIDPKVFAGLFFALVAASQGD